MPSTTVTTLLVPDFDSQTLVAEVLGADSTATTYLLNCPSDVESNLCGLYNNTITLGPWASKTLPPGAAETGIFDYEANVDFEEGGENDEGWEFSVHCKMSRSVAQECTMTNNLAEPGSQTEIISDASLLSASAPFAYKEMTITAGAELLSASQTLSGEAKSTGTGSSDDSEGGEGEEDGAALRLPSMMVAGLATLVAAAWIM